MIRTERRKSVEEENLPKFETNNRHRSGPKDDWAPEDLPGMMDIYRLSRLTKEFGQGYQAKQNRMS